MEEVRGELREIAREAAVLLRRERGRGRERIPVTLEAEGASALRPGEAPDPGRPIETPAPGAWPAETLALPGFESFASTAPASHATCCRPSTGCSRCPQRRSTRSSDPFACSPRSSGAQAQDACSGADVAIGSSR